MDPVAGYDQVVVPQVVAELPRHRDAAVGAFDLSGDELGRGRAQECHRHGDILRDPIAWGDLTHAEANRASSTSSTSTKRDTIAAASSGV